VLPEYEGSLRTDVARPRVGRKLAYALWLPVAQSCVIDLLDDFLSFGMCCTEVAYKIEWSSLHN